MSASQGDALDDLIQEFSKDPEFVREARRLAPYYDLLVQLIRRRHELGLTQKELARAAGTFQSRVSRIESGEYDFRLSTLIQLTEALGTQVVIKLVPFVAVVESSENVFARHINAMPVIGTSAATEPIEYSEGPIFFHIPPTTVKA